MKIQKQITATEYRGYQLRHSSETGHVGVYKLVRDGFGSAWHRIRACNSMALAKAYVDRLKEIS